MKNILLPVAFSTLLISSSNAVLIAYWDQNSNDLPGGGFGFLTTAFPQAADQGSGSLTLVDFDTTTETTSGGDEIFDFIASFGGTDLNAEPTITGGGSLSPQGGTGNSNNGMSIVVEVATLGLTDITVSWAQRGTSSGFDSRDFDYSLNGTDWVDVGVDSGDLSSTWEPESYDLSAVDAIEDQPSVFFRITLDGATGSTGNNRFDNIKVEAVPEPSVALLGAFGVLGLIRRRR